MNSKKGLSDVITTVLIILLAIAAVVIIWSFVRPAITNAGQQVETQSECFSANVEVVSCNASTIQYRSNEGSSRNVRVVYTLNDDTTGSSQSLTLTSYQATSLAPALGGKTLKSADISALDSAGNSCPLHGSVTCA